MSFFNELKPDLIESLQTITQWNQSQLTEAQRDRYEILLTVIHSMVHSPDLWEHYCPFNIQIHGKDFSDMINLLNNQSQKTPDNILEVRIPYSLCLRFITELDFSSSQVLDFDLHNDKNNKLFELINKLKDKAFESNDAQDAEVRYAFYQMPIKILHFYINNKELKAFLEFENNKNQIDHSVSKANEELRKTFTEADKLKKALEKYETAFNFVRLSKGFTNLLKKKNCAKWLTFSGLVTLLLAAIMPLCFSFYKFIQGDDLSWQKMLPVIGLEFVLIYFFRVVLSHYHAIQTQIMQLELRQSLCQFIQSYVKYAKEIKISLKAEQKDPLEKFENLIFSSILSNPDKVPGTFDGIDGLTSLLKEIKGR